MHIKRMMGKRGQPNLLYAFSLGFLLGIFFIQFFGKAFYSDAGIFSDYMLDVYKYTPIDAGDFMMYLCQTRLGLILLMSLLSTTVFGILSIYAAALWCGISIGMILSAATIRFGIKGILLFLAGTMPHFILYVPAFLYFLNICYKLCTKLYFSDREFVHSERNKKQEIALFFARNIVVFAVVIIGIFLESYVNPNFFAKVLKFF